MIKTAMLSLFMFVIVLLSLMIMLSSFVSENNYQQFQSLTTNTTNSSTQTLMNYTAQTYANIQSVQVNPNDERDIMSIMGRYATATIKMFITLPTLLYSIYDFTVDSLNIRQYVSFIEVPLFSALTFLVAIGILEIALRWWIK